MFASLHFRLRSAIADQFPLFRPGCWTCKVCGERFYWPEGTSARATGEAMAAHACWKERAARLLEQWRRELARHHKRRVR